MISIKYTVNVSLCRRIPGVVRIYFTALSSSDLARGKELVDVHPG